MTRFDCSFCCLMFRTYGGCAADVPRSPLSIPTGGIQGRLKSRLWVVGGDIRHQLPTIMEQPAAPTPTRTGICGERGSIRAAYPALPPWPGTRDKGKQAHETTPVTPHPKLRNTGVAIATETAIKDHEQMAVLKVGTCQFPIGADIGANLRHVKRQMVTASRRGARIAHSPEGSLSGYAGTDFESFASYDWDRLHDATAEIAEHARQLRLWVVLGSAHRLSGSHKPHNSLYVFNDSGQIAERYDKRFCPLDCGLARASHVRHPAQRHPGQRPALRRPDPNLTSSAAPAPTVGSQRTCLAASR
jgi:hypothetical protein